MSDKTKDQVLASIESGEFYDRSELDDLGSELRADKDVILAWINFMDEEDDWSYRQFEYVSPEIASDKEIVLSLVSKRGRALEWAAEELKRDKDVAIAAVTNDGDALEDVYWEIRGDREIVLAACRSKRGRYTLSFISDSDELMSDREIVLAAALQGKFALQYASEDLKGDRELVLAAVNANGHALSHAAEDLKSDIELVIAALNTCKKQGEEPRDILEHLPENICSDVSVQDFLASCEPSAEQFKSAFDD